MRSGPPRIVLILMLGTLVFMSSYMLSVAWKAAAIQDGAAHWPTSDGVVIESRVEERSDRRVGMTYEPVIRYRYFVEGVAREGSDTSFNPIQVAREDAYKMVESYPVGRSVRVWYSPHHPKWAVLDPSRADWTVTQLLGVVLAFALTGFGLAIFWPWLGGDPLTAKARVSQKSP